MRYYTVEQVAEAIGKSPETVRRLLRDNNSILTAPKPTSSKSGWKIPEDSLRRFLETSPKYMTTAARDLLSSSSTIPFIIGGIVGGIVTILATRKKREVTADQIKEYINQEITKNEKNAKKVEQDISKKQKKINELQAEIDGLQIELENSQKTLRNYQYALSEINCEELAESINQNLSQV